jgi:hypothetical protein
MTQQAPTAAVSPELRRLGVDRFHGNVPCGNNNMFDITLPYYSKGKVSAARTSDGAGHFSYVVAAGTIVSFFSYGRGQPKLSAGFSANDGNASNSDTNILRPGETINGESLRITGLSFVIMPAGTDGAAATTGPDLRLVDKNLVAALFSFCSLQCQINARGYLDFGPLILMPGAAGLEGRAPTISDNNALAGSMIDGGFVNNGMPNAGNAFGFDAPIWWNDDGADSNITFNLRVDRNIVLWSGGDVDNKQGNTTANNLAGEVATGTQGYNFPSIVMCEILCRLHGQVLGERSRTI